MEPLSLQHYGVAMNGCNDGFGTAAACVISSDVRLGKLIFCCYYCILAASSLLQLLALYCV